MTLWYKLENSHFQAHFNDRLAGIRGMRTQYFKQFFFSLKDELNNRIDTCFLVVISLKGRVLEYYPYLLTIPFLNICRRWYRWFVSSSTEEDLRTYVTRFHSLFLSLQQKKRKKSIVYVLSNAGKLPFSTHSRNLIYTVRSSRRVYLSRTDVLHSNALCFFSLQMASKLILGCLVLMVASTYARSSKLLFCGALNTMKLGCRVFKGGLKYY